MHFNPILNTSLRGHGKWGDFLVALIPLSWCGNILANSNFILRMIEWQNESSLFTLRVQGKQWYWVYKFDSNLVATLKERPFNIGHNKWVYTQTINSALSAQYLDISLLSTQLEYQLMYTNLLKENALDPSSLLNDSYTNSTYLTGLLGQQEVVKASSLVQTTAQLNPNLDDTSNFAGNLLLTKPSFKFTIKKGVLNLFVLETFEQLQAKKSLAQNLLLVPSFSKPSGQTVEKVWDPEFFWGFRQRKYKRASSYSFSRRTPQTRLMKLLDKQVFQNYQAIKYNKHRTELVPVTLARRLLRTKRTLVLPAHINLTVITNSYDVVHSWFIPGLGIKMDCVPGRSTHHTFYIDSVGFFYGQCAEICGRYHHHMPIRICALPIEQFVVWWEHKGYRRHTRYVDL